MPTESMKVRPERSSVTRRTPGVSSACSRAGSTENVVAMSNSPSMATVSAPSSESVTVGEWPGIAPHGLPIRPRAYTANVVLCA